MMKRSIFAALAVFAAPSAALAAVPPDLTKPESLCPGIGLPDLEFGKVERAQNMKTLEALRQEWPLGSGEAQFTNWSGQLFAVEWRMPNDDAAASLVWRNGIEDWLDANGWTPAELPQLKSLFSMEPSMAVKTVNGRTLVIEYDTPGIQLLRCADRELLEQDRRELEGELNPGSPRPARPPVATLAWRLPDPSECAKPELAAAFGGTTRPQDIGPTIARYFSLDDPMQEEAAYQRRLNTWLKWKLRTEGKLTMEQVWALDRPGEKATAGLDVDIAIIESFGGAIEAQKSGDGRKSCEAGIAILKAMHEDATSEAESERKANAPLEAEARRLGVAVD